MNNFQNNNKEDKSMQTLSETARVMTPRQALKSTKPNRAKRMQLRHEAIMGYIKSKPAGERIKLKEFGRVIYLSGDNQINEIIKRMLSKGIIGRIEIAPKKYSYYLIKDDSTIITKPRRVPTVEPDQFIMNKAPEADVPVRYTTDDVERLAMKFAWTNPDKDVTSLREFFAWIKEENK